MRTSASVVATKRRCATATNRQSTTISAALRPAIAPDRKVVSLVTVVKTTSAITARGELTKLVIATVVAPRRLAWLAASIVSAVVPEWLSAIATSAGPRLAAEVIAMRGSAQRHTLRPIRCRFCWRSWATMPLAPTPIVIARALSVDPDVLVADEAVSMIAVILRLGILALLARLRAELGLALVFVSYDVAAGRYVGAGGELLVLYRGQVIERGPTKAVIAGPLHPYTQCLLSAIPVGDRCRDESQELTSTATQGHSVACWKPVQARVVPQRL